MVICAKESPEEAGWPGLVHDEVDSSAGVRMSIGKCFTTVFTHPLIWFYAVAYACTGAVRSSSDQLAVLYLLALYEGARLGRMDAAAVRAHIEELLAVPAKIETALDGWREQMAALASKYKSAATFLYLGRGIHYAIAREGALKLKEASYVHAEGYPVGELKHGPNALVSDQVPLVVLATVDRALEASLMRYGKTLQLLVDMKAQGAKVIAIANADDAEIAGLASDCVRVEAASEYLLPLLEVVPTQLFSYFMALEHGVDVDRPRNLSKAVLER